MRKFVLIVTQDDKGSINVDRYIEGVFTTFELIGFLETEKHELLNNLILENKSQNETNNNPA